MFQKGRVIGMLEGGLSIRTVAQRMNCGKNTVQKWWNNYRQYGNVTRKIGSGRPKKSNQRQNQQLVLAVKRNRFQSLSRTYNQYNNINRLYSLRTAYRRVLAAGYRSHRPVIRIPLTVRHRQNRLIWCRDHIDAPIGFWKNIMWTDESRFLLDFNDGRIRVRRLSTERFAECCIAEHDRYGLGSVMIWGGIWYAGRTAMIHIQGSLNAIKYRDEIVLPIIIPTCEAAGLTLQQDNAPPHTANAVGNTLRESNVFKLNWPARSPDLSPIEHLWDVMQRRLNTEYPFPAATLIQLVDRLREQWNLIPQETIVHLIDSVPRRLQNCIAVRGGHTRY